MAQLIPQVSLDSIWLLPERTVARSLVKLMPQSVRIYHSYCWLFPARDAWGSPLREGEADFIVLDPKRGLLVLEVKGGDVRFNPETALWYRKLPGEDKHIKDPFKQARFNLHEVMKVLGKAGIPKESFPGTYGYGVVFPDCEFQGTLPSDVDGRILMTAKDLAFLDRRIGQVFSAWSGKHGRGRELTTVEHKAVVGALTPAFQTIPALWRTIENDEEQLLSLTEDQFEALEAVAENPRVLVKGGAGTGKTLLAFHWATQLASGGQDVLFLCYNTKLADWLNDRAKEVLQQPILDRLRIINFHKLCRWFYTQAHEPFQVPDVERDKQAFWANEVPNHLVDSLLDRVPEARFDVILVDEAQDFDPDWWLVVDLLSKEAGEGALYVFMDAKQNVYDQTSILPDLPVSLPLRFNCRNSKSIAKQCKRILDTGTESKRRAPEGTFPEIFHTSSPGEQRRLCEQFLRQWVRQGKLKPHQVAILSSHSFKDSCLAAGSPCGGVNIVEDLDAWKHDQGVLFSTIRTFKGLEADAVIVLEKARLGEGIQERTNLYVGCSRAKHLLVVLHESPHVNLFD